MVRKVCSIICKKVVKGHTPAFMGKSRKKEECFLSLICVVEPTMDGAKEKQKYPSRHIHKTKPNK